MHGEVEYWFKICLKKKAFLYVKQKLQDQLCLSKSYGPENPRNMGNYFHI